MTVTQWALVSGILVLSAMFQSAIGFGSSLIAVPLVAQVAPEAVPGSVVVATVALNLAVLIREREAVDLTPLRPAALGAVAGTSTAALLLQTLSDRALLILVAVCVLAMVALVASGATPQRTRKTMLAAGAGAGFASTAAGIPGPPIALVYTDADGARVRGSLAAFFLLAGTFTMIGLRLTDRLDGSTIRTGILLMPAVLIGFALGKPVIPFVDRGFTRPTILVVSAVSAGLLLLRALA
ncbi:MAG: sulfite exporter TauE/SafE family protein [Acidimicrobiales bacterium]